MSCLSIFEINYLSVVSFAIIFSHSEGCLFTLLIVSFAVQKLLRLISSKFFMLFFFHYIRRWVREDLGEGNGTPLQYFASKIPWMKEPGGLQSMGSQRVGHG